MTPPPPAPVPLLLDLLDAAGLDLAPCADGSTWAAVDRASGYEWGLGESPACAGRAALAALRQRYTTAAAGAAQVERMAVELAEARERLPEGEQWCELCQGYEYDYGCACRRCVECDAKLAPHPSHGLIELLGELLLCEECAARVEGRRAYRGRRGPRPERRPPLGPALGL